MGWGEAGRKTGRNSREDAGSQELGSCEGQAGREFSGSFGQKAKELFLEINTFQV